MPSEKSARVAERRYRINRPVRTQVRTFRRKAEEALRSGNLEEAEAAVRQAQRILDRAARKRVIHRNKAARIKSKLMRRLHQLRLQVAAQQGGATS